MLSFGPMAIEATFRVIDELSGAPGAGESRSLLLRHQKFALVLFIVVVVYPWYYIIGFKTARLPLENLPTLELPIDRAWPLHGPWILAYELVYFFCFLPLCSIRDTRLFRRLFTGYLLVLLVSFVAFTVYPVKMIRPAFEPSGFLEWGVRLNHEWDPPVNCFPSVHVGTAYMAALGIWRIDRIAGPLAYLGATAIGFSTMFVKQHWALDVVGGFAVAHLAWALFLRGYDRAPLTDAEARLPRRWYLVVFGIYAAVVLGFWFVYRSGFAPWQASQPAV